MRPRDPNKVREWASAFGGRAAAALVETLTAEEIGQVAAALDAQAKEFKAASAEVAKLTASLDEAEQRRRAAMVEAPVVAAVKTRLLSAVNAMNGVQASAGASA